MTFDTAMGTSLVTWMMVIPVECGGQTLGRVYSRKDEKKEMESK